jgi:hypothetical protein
MEVVAIDNHILIKINGKTTADSREIRNMRMSGHLAIQVLTRGQIAFRKIEVKELEPGLTPPP